MDEKRDEVLGRHPRARRISPGHRTVPGTGGGGSPIPSATKRGRPSAPESGDAPKWLRIQLDVEPRRRGARGPPSCAVLLERQRRGSLTACARTGFRSDVAARLEQVAILLDQMSLEALAEEMIDPLVDAVRLDRKATVELAHPVREAGVADLEHQVVVVRHQAPRQNAPTVAPRSPVRAHGRRASRSSSRRRSPGGRSRACARGRSRRGPRSCVACPWGERRRKPRAAKRPFRPCGGNVTRTCRHGSRYTVPGTGRRTPGAWLGSAA